MTVPLSVTGGVGGLTASYADITTEAQQLTALSGRLLELAASLQAMLADPNVVAGAALDPGGAARFEGALAYALDGPNGLTLTATGIGAHALTTRGTVLAYQAKDAALASMASSLQYAAGEVVGSHPLAVGAAGAAGIAAWLADEKLQGRDAAADAQQFLTSHPWLTRDIVNMAPGVIDASIENVSGPMAPLLRKLLGLPPFFPTTVPEAAGLAGLLYPDGSPHVVADPAYAVTPPTGLGSLFAELGAEEGNSQQVLVDKVAGPNGQGVVIELPGTQFDHWNLVPLQQYTTPYDLSTNLRSMSAAETTYLDGVVQSIESDPDITKSTPIMTLGHSQGGMIATQLAARLSADGYDVTHVATAGSPVATMTVPDSVQELSLQNTQDVVPQLSGVDNPDLPNRTTVSFAAGDGTVGGDHSVADVYAPVAAQIDQDTEASIARWKQGTDVFFGGTSATQTALTITRTFPAASAGH